MTNLYRIIGYLAATLVELAMAGAFGAVSQDENGWTVVTASGDSRIIYVSSSDGDDADDGLSEANAKATIAAGAALMRNGYPDHILLKRGDTWTVTTNWNPISGRSASEPAYIGAYGTGARPKIRRTMDTDVGGVAAIRPNNDAYIVVQSIHFDGTLREAVEGALGNTGVAIAGTAAHITVEDCLVDWFGTNITCGGLSNNVTIRRSIIVNSWNDPTSAGHSSGIWVAQCTGLLIEENVIDHNGWNDAGGEYAGAGNNLAPTNKNHGMYLTYGCRDVTVRENVISRNSALTIKFQPNGGTHYITNNLMIKSSNAGQIGGGQDTIEGQGIIVYWDNNVHIDPVERGAQLYAGLVSDNLESGSLRNNILAHADSKTTQAYWTRGWEDIGIGVNNFRIENNVTYNWWSGFGIGGGNALVFKNNTIHLPNLPADRYIAGASSDSSANFAEISGNKYYSGAAEGGWFLIDNTPISGHAAWVAATGETGSSIVEPTYTDANRDADSFAVSKGYADWDGWIADLKLQQRGDWDETIMADAANDYFRAGFDVTEYADTVPSIVSWTVSADGDSTTVVFDEAVTGTTGHGLSMTLTDGAVTMTYSSGSGTDTYVFSNSRTVQYDETGTGSASSSVLQDGDTNALADVSGFQVSNISTIGEGADVTPPVFSSANVDSDGLVTVNFNEQVTSTSAAGWSVDAPYEAVTVAFRELDPGKITLQLSRIPYSWETLTVSYDSGTGNVEDLSGNAAGDITSESITNNSTRTKLGMILR